MNDPDSSDKPASGAKKRGGPIGTHSLTGSPAEVGIPAPPEGVVVEKDKDGSAPGKPTAGKAQPGTATPSHANIGEIPPEIEP